MIIGLVSDFLPECIWFIYSPGWYIWCKSFIFVSMPPPFLIGAYSTTLVRTYVRPVPYVPKMVSGLYLGVLNSYFIHGFTCIIMKYRSSSITYKIHQLYQSYGYEKWFSGDIFLIHWCIGFLFHTQLYNHKIQVKFYYG